MRNIFLRPVLESGKTGIYIYLMQFIKNIPNKLVKARDKGDVIFLCGAGVSMKAGLPSYEKLVKKIYQKLLQDMQDEEKTIFDERRFDETLWALETRLGGRTQKGRVQIIKKIHQILAEPYRKIDENKLKHHKNLLKISEGLPLITTNFDTLFEKSAQNVKSYTGPAFPDFDPEEFQGVIHLHGRVVDEACKLEA
ncbi:MAG: hypothetical protein OXT03_04400, partial [Alphaproteobacteria bacterium]|nr:hypothetical protein [Alphaproteobacteria bacterium]